MSRGQDWAPLASETGWAARAGAGQHTSRGCPCHQWDLSPVGASEPTPRLGQGSVSLDHIQSCPVLVGMWDQAGPEPPSPSPLGRFHKCHLLLPGHFLKEKLSDTKELWTCSSTSLSMSC